MIYVLRHGEIEETARGRYVGQTDVALSERGRHQAVRWGKWAAGKKLGAVFCSDLARSFETAAIMAERLHLKPRVDRHLREIHLGEWEGRLMQEVRTESPMEWEQRGACMDTFRPPGGESFLDLSRRVVPVFTQIAEIDADATLIVGHAGVNRVILCHVLGLPIRSLFALKQDYGALNLIDNSRGEVQVAAVNIQAEQCI